MKYLLIPLMCVLAATKVTSQSYYSQSRKLTFADNLFYNCIMFAVPALAFLPIVLLRGISLVTLLYGILSGTLGVVFQISYMLAFSKGKPLLVTTVNNFGMFIPVFVSCFAFHEDFGVFKLIALVLAGGSLYLITSKRGSSSQGAQDSNAWLFLALIAFLSGGAISSVQKVYAKMSGEDFDAISFVAVTYATATVLALGAYLIVKRKSGFRNERRREALASASMAGAALGAFQCVSTYAATQIDGVILYSVYNVSVNVLFAFVRMAFFGERLSRKQIAGILLALGAILFMG